LKEQQKVADAEPLRREAVESLKRLIASGRQTVRTSGADLANNLHLLAQIVRAEEKLDEAEAFLREALQATQTADPADPWNVLKSKTELAQLLQARRKFPEAEALYRQVVQTSHMLLPPENPGLTRYLSLLIKCLGQEGKRLEAEDLVREVAAINRKSLAAKPPG
jgi:tetratricopeptide (TPR) repeat protein